MLLDSSRCYHCGLPVPDNTNLTLNILNESRRLCCHGCLAVAEAIVDNGLSDYYRHRTDLPKSGEELVPDELRKLDLYDHPEVQRSFVHEVDHDTRQASLIIEGITCAACIWLNERHLRQLPGISMAVVNYSSHRARITWDNSKIKLSQILVEIIKLGYHAHPFNVQRQEELRQQDRKLDIRRIAVGGLCAGQVMMLAVALYAGAAQGMEHGTTQLLRWFSLLLTAPALFYSALPFYVSAWNVLKSGRLNMDVPITLGIVTGFIGSIWNTIQGTGTVYYDTITMLIFFLLATRFLERGAREKSVEAAENLLRLAPAMATRVISGLQELVPVMELSSGDLILVRPGETIAADGLITEGNSSVDESLITGESRQLAKTVGDKVIAGSINYESSLMISVTDTAENTVLAGIARLLDRAQEEKPHLATMADKVAVGFTYGLLIIAAIVAIFWYWLDATRTFEIVLSVLVVSCPCALSLAAPAAFAAASSHLISRGVLLTRGHALETLSRATRFVFDKTGTLTKGKPELSLTITTAEIDAATCLNIAASLEQPSEHPLAQSFLSTVNLQNIIPVKNFENCPGFGLIGTLNNTRYSLGNPSLTPEIKLPLICEPLPPGSTVIWLCDVKRALAAFVLSDTLRPQSEPLINSLHSNGIKTSILSGDASNTVAYFAEKLMVNDWCAELTPEGKLTTLKKWEVSGEVIAMIGDGINDAPVLAGAPVSIAMGSGTHMARTSSDMVLLSKNILEIDHARLTSRFTMNIIRQNFVWALAYNLIALPFAASGNLSPWLAALGMSVSSLVVVLNALRLK